jgi:hypothetical protein
VNGNETRAAAESAFGVLPLVDGYAGAQQRRRRRPEAPVFAVDDASPH